MSAVSSRTGRAPPAAPMATADLEAAIAALPVRKQRLRETFDRLVACAPPHYHLPFTWDDIDAHVSSLHASLALRFRQMQQQQQQPHSGVPVSAPAAPDDEQPHPGVPVSPTATPIGEQPDPCVLVSATHGESIQEDEEMVREEEDASPAQEDDRVEDAGMGFAGAPWRQAGGTRDQEFPVPVRAHYARHAGSPILRQPYTASPPDVHSQLNLPMLQRQQPFMPYQQQEFPAMAVVAMNNYNIPPMVHQPYYNIPPVVQQPYYNIPPMVQQPYFRQEFSPDFRREFSPDFRQEFLPDVTRQPLMVQRPYSPYFRREFSPDFRREFLPDVTRQPPTGIDHVLQEQQYMAMAHHQPYFPQQQYMARHQPHFPAAQAASAHGQGSNAAKRRPLNRSIDTDNINVRISEPSKKSRTIREHEPYQNKTIYDYF
ncbi:hypothetical protein CFC21_103169 [Triticum aestivum]|uniref:Uncharacterized protein n=2 Tax=Triticum aestivum TaxID=4565 RepID=A0A9R1N600_WHEAT|nr:uncharacterized protein LOC123085329 [Triticum aestivum]KAF7101969.1 hypothetical protein CFC21_103169 [Triticum aestivum]